MAKCGSGNRLRHHPALRLDRHERPHLDLLQRPTEPYISPCCHPPCPPERSSTNANTTGASPQPHTQCCMGAHQTAAVFCYLKAQPFPRTESQTVPHRRDGRSGSNPGSANVTVAQLAKCLLSTAFSSCVCETGVIVPACPRDRK